MGIPSQSPNINCNNNNNNNHTDIGVIDDEEEGIDTGIETNDTLMYQKNQYYHTMTNVFPFTTSSTTYTTMNMNNPTLIGTSDDESIASSSDSNNNQDSNNNCQHVSSNHQQQQEPESLQQQQQSMMSLIVDSPTSVITKKNTITGSESDHTMPSATTRRRDMSGDPTSDSKSSSTVPSSEYVLNVAFYSFVGFMIIQGFFAYYVAHSSAMMADCEAMSVDAITYLFNLCAERLKHRPFTEYEIQFLSIEQRRHKRKLLICYYEFIPPLLSVVTLVLVTIYTLQDSITKILLISSLHTNHNISSSSSSSSSNDNSNQEEDVSIPVMLLFSFINLLLDIVNVTCFTRSGFVQQTIPKPLNLVESQNNNKTCEHIPLLLSSSSSKTRTTTSDNDNSYNSINKTNNNETDIEDQMIYTEINTSRSTELNLNMCSAWTHVCADTMRSAAVLIAAGIAISIPVSNEIEQQYYATMADSIAAIAVSIIILLSIIPLLQGLYKTGQQIIQLQFSNQYQNHSHCHNKNNKHSELSIIVPNSLAVTTFGSKHVITSYYMHQVTKGNSHRNI